MGPCLWTSLMLDLIFSDEELSQSMGDDPSFTDSYLYISLKMEVSPTSCFLCWWFLSPPSYLVI